MMSAAGDELVSEMAEDLRMSRLPKRERLARYVLFDDLSHVRESLIHVDLPPPDLDRGQSILIGRPAPQP